MGFNIELLNGIMPIIIEEELGTENQYVALLFKADVNSWLGSREIDGEQVMTNN